MSIHNLKINVENTNKYYRKLYNREISIIGNFMKGKGRHLWSIKRIKTKKILPQKI